MGTDKALIEVGGRPLAARVVDALVRAGVTPVVCVGGDLDALREAGLDPIPDRHPGQGPLGGVLTALADAATAEAVVVLPADLLSPDPGAIGAVVDALLADPVAVLAVPVVEGRAQWLHAAWRRSALPLLRDRFEAGERSIHRAVEGLEIVRLSGLPAAALRDADTPADLIAPDGPGELP